MQRRQFLFRGRALLREMLVAEQVADLIGIAQVAAIKRLKWIAPERAFVAVFEQLEQAVVSAGLRGRGRRRLSLQRRRNTKRQERISGRTN